MSLSPETDRKKLGCPSPAVSPNTAPIVYTVTNANANKPEKRRAMISGGVAGVAVVTDAANTRHIIVSEAGEGLFLEGHVADFRARAVKRRRAGKCQGRFIFSDALPPSVNADMVPSRFRRLVARKVKRNKAYGWQIAYGDTCKKAITCAACGSDACRSITGKPPLPIREAWEWGIVARSGAVVGRWAAQPRQSDSLQAFVDAAVDDVGAGKPLDFKKLYTFQPEQVAVKLIEIQEREEFGEA